jgi:hypothetical protein
VRNLYVESLIIRPPGGRSAPPLKAFVCLARNFIPLIARVCEPANLECVYALGASGRGESFIRALGFTLVTSARGGTDPRRLYVAQFSALEANISELYHRRLGKN